MIADGLAGPVLRAAARHPRRTAIALEAGPIAYEDLLGLAGRIAAAIGEVAPGVAPDPPVGVLAGRRLAGYAGVLGAVMAGRGFLPLPPGGPVARSRAMLAAGRVTTLVVGPDEATTLPALLAAAPEPVTILGPECPGFGDLPGRLPGHRFLAAGELARLAPAFTPSEEPAALACLLFTSGTTGRPKGVPLRNGNLAAYFAHARDAWALGPEDRASHAFDLTFDLSLHDMFLAWGAGACLCPLPAGTLMPPIDFVADQRLTTWFSVPTLASAMARLRMFRPGAFPALRAARFCGEALPAATAEAWALAAPNAAIDNLYGPTEATIAIMAHRWGGEGGAAGRTDGVVPIGRPFPGHEARLVDPAGTPIAGPGRGELELAGPQVVAGYQDDPAETARRFSVGADGKRWYRTGDLAARDDAGTYRFLGRADDQIKLAGHRIELQEVDAELRAAAGTALAATVPWPLGPDGVEGLVGVIEAAEGLDLPAVMAALRATLPAYMVPDRLVTAPAGLPRSPHGKLDRRALAAMLTDGRLGG